MYSLQRPKHRRLSSLLACALTIGASSTWAAEIELFSESFETDGAGTRYIVENPSDDGASDYNARRQLGSAGTRVRGAIDGTWFWGLRDLDAEGTAVNDLNDDDGRITWTDTIDITNLGNLRLEVAAAQGGDEQEWDNVVAFQLRIDGGEWINIGGFRGRHTNSPSHYFTGDLRTFPDKTNPRLTQQFSSWDWDVFVTGSTAELRMFTNMNGGSEEVAFDDVRIYADDAVEFATFAADADTYSETAGSGTFTITLPSAAPAGGVVFQVYNTDTDGDEVALPSTITVPEGQTVANVSFDVIADGRFDGDELVIVRFEAPGYARDQVRFTVTNVDAKPNVVINEFLPVLNNLDSNVAPENLPLYDVNNDGRTDEDEEQFIEIVNLEDSPVDISLWTVNDELQIRHIFPEGTILPAGGVILVFADAVPQGVFGGAIVQVTELVSPNFDEDGDIAQLVAGGAVVDSIAYTGELGETYDSITRSPDLTGTTETVADHSTIAEANGALWSPGTKIDGSYFFDYSSELALSLDAETVSEGATVGATVTTSSAAGVGGLTVNLFTTGPNADEVGLPASVIIPEGLTEVNFVLTALDDGVLDGDRLTSIRAEATSNLPAETTTTVLDVATEAVDIVINEAFGDVLGSGADPNGNGILEEPVADQFIEIVNAGNSDVSLSGWQVVSWRTNQPGGPQTVHIFPAGTVLPAEGSVVIFGGGDEATLQGLSDSLFGGALIQVANNHGNGVNVTAEGNDGEITLLTPYGYEEDKVIFGDDATEQNQSLVRSPELTGAFGALHLEVSGAFEVSSPGRQLDGTAFSGNAVIEGATWAGFEVDENGWADTDGWLGSVNTTFAPWLFVYGPGVNTLSDTSDDWASFMYIPEPAADATGTWAYAITSGASTATGGISTWAGYPVDGNDFVDSDNWIGAFSITFSPYIYMYHIDSFAFSPEPTAGFSGQWIYIFK